MEALTIGAQFAAVFLAAFLAIGLENARERRRTRRWVREYLGQLQELIGPELANQDTVRQAINGVSRALDRWLAAEEPDQMSDEDWDQLSGGFNTTPPDFGAVLRSEALTELPRDVALSLARVEVTSRDVHNLTDALADARREVMPVLHARTVPLSPPDASRVRRVRSLVTEMTEPVVATYRHLGTAIAALDNWR